MNPRAHSGVGCGVPPRGWWDPAALARSRAEGCWDRACTMAGWGALLVGAGEEGTPLACSWDASLAMSHSQARGSKVEKGSGCRGVGVSGCWGAGAGRSGPARGQAGRTRGHCCPAACGEGDTEARGFPSLFFTSSTAKAGKQLPWAGSTFLGATQAAAAWGAAPEGEHPAREPQGCAGARAASQGWHPSSQRWHPSQLPTPAPGHATLCPLLCSALPPTS